MSSPVIIIGAGVSGLASAKWLTKAGVEAIVLEARNRVGGRTWTIQTSNTGYCDIGGAYIGGTQNNLLRILQEYNLDKNLYEINVNGNYVFMVNGKRHVVSGEAFPSFWNPLVTMDVNNFFRKMDEMGEEIPAEAPWSAPHAEEWDQMTFKEFIDKTCWTNAARELAYFFIAIDVTSEAYEASLLWLLWYVKQCGGVKRIISVRNGGQERKLKGGMQQVSEKMAQQLGDRVKLNEPVVGISQTKEGVTVKTLDGSEYKGSHVIIAVPPALQMKFHYDPPLPPLRNQLIQRLPMGSVWKCILYYKEAFWKSKGYCAAMMFTLSEDCPVVYTLDDTKPDGSYPAIIGFLVADKARKLLRLSPKERCTMIARSYARAFQCDDALNPVHYEEFNWMTEQYSGGCYTAMMPPGLLTTFRSVLRDPIGRIYFAGTETATEWSGYINGGIQAGERAAREVLHSLGKISKQDIFVREPENRLIPTEPFPTTFSERYLPSVPGFLRLVGFGAVAAFVIAKRTFCQDLISRKLPESVQRLNVFNA